MKENIKPSSLHNAGEKYVSGTNDAKIMLSKTKVKKGHFPDDFDVDTYRPSFRAEILSSNCSEIKDKKGKHLPFFWGNVKPCWFNSQTKVPRMVISTSFLRSLLVNLLIIATICILIPLLINHLISRQIPLVSGSVRLLSQIRRYLTSQNSVSGQQGSIQSQHQPPKLHIIEVYATVWAFYQVIFLFILLFSNPGYGEFLIKGQESGTAWNGQIASSKKGDFQENSRCSICKSIVDHTVIHCSKCNICCEGFSHHCDWVGKCVGYQNTIFLKGYFYGYVIGILALIVVIMLQSLQYQ